MRGALTLLVLVPFAAAALLLGAMNLGAEVVTLTTTDERGSAHRTPLWIVDDGDELWIRAERPTSAWLARLRERPGIQIERGGLTTSYRAVPAPERRDYVNRRMAERYGWAEWTLAWFQDREAAVPIRLEAEGP